MTFIRSYISLIAIFAMGLPYCPGQALQSVRISPADSSGVEVRLEPHEKQIDFQLGDPIQLDLVLTAKFPGYAVSMDSNRFNAPQELVNVTPADGWFRSQGPQYGGSPEDLGQSPVRIPVMLNRSIVFQKAGHYEMSITTSRVAPSRTGVPPGTQCCAPRWSETTNAVAVDILPRGDQEESVLVARLSSLMDLGKPDTFLSDEWKKQHAPLMREMDDLEKDMKKSPLALDRQKVEKVMREFHAAEAEDEALIAKQTESRRQTAVQLSYLQGDDAVRQKVRRLLADKEDGTDDTGLVMLDGLAHSRNLQLQMQLLHDAWIDTRRVPTGVLQSALQQTKAFLQNETFDLYYSHGVPVRTLPHTQVVKEYNRELSEIVATLPLRTGSNREQTAYYLATSAHGLNPADASILRAEIAQEFAGLSSGMQATLLGMGWKQLCDPALPIPPEPLKSACASTHLPESEAPVP